MRLSRHSGMHRNFKKWSEHAVFCTFLLENVLLATAACNFSTSQLQKVVRSWCVLYIFTSKCASHHSGVLFLISPLTTWLRTRRFNEPTFRLTRHTNHWKNTAFRDFSNIWRGCIFFLLTFALLHLLSSDFTSSSDFTFFWLYFICFSTLHIVGSLLFKLPSISVDLIPITSASPQKKSKFHELYHVPKFISKHPGWLWEFVALTYDMDWNTHWSNFPSFTHSMSRRIQQHFWATALRQHHFRSSTL